MISILIPVYNQDVNILVARLSAGLSHLGQAGEIIVMEDGSDAAYQQFNSPLATLPFVRYIPHAQNNGRIRIRQMLAAAAVGEWLLFLDGDSELGSDNFLQQYYLTSHANTGVVVGGRKYSTTPPDDCAFRLHWKYGSARESRRSGGKQQPAFMTNNFLIQAPCFNQLLFDTGGEGYGHEDTWIGIQLEKAGIPVNYIDNPVLHTGLEKNKTFIAKSENALLNLHKLSTQVPGDMLARHVKLFRVYQTLKKWNGLWIAKSVYKLLRKYITSNLHSCNPSLTLFDLYRLQYFIRLNNQK